MLVDPAKEFELSIHRRLLTGDNVAPEELVEAYLRRLVNTLRKGFWQHDETIFADAAIDALFSYIQKPMSYDPERSGLFNFLAMAARKDLLNAVKRKVTRTKHEVVVSSVEDERDRRNIEMDPADPSVPGETRRINIIYGREVTSKLRHEIRDPKDWKLLELMSDRVRDTKSYVEVLGISNLSGDEQRRMVKQHKDRLGKQLERFGAKLRAKSKR
jgi:hypothetical protein